MKYENINVVKNNIPYSKVVELVEFVVNNSYGQDGMYHEYLKDYAETVAIITMYTDCDITNHSFDDIMELRTSEKWNSILCDLSSTYDQFDKYVNSEIEYRNTPLRYADNLTKTLIVTVSSINDIIKKIDVGALENYDFSKILNALDSISNEDTKKIIKTNSKRKTNTKPELTVIK